MKYLSFEELEIELTRRCNMRPPCPHCFKGEAQIVDLSRDDIDALIGQTEMIGHLTLFGGEPTLMLDNIEYILERCRDENVPVFSMSIISNGLYIAEPVADVIKKWAEYIQKCNADWKGNNATTDHFIELRISVDSYHSHSDFVKRQIEKYKTLLSNIAQVNVSKVGQVPTYTGRAIDLGIDNCRLVPDSKKANRQISMLDKDHKPLCLQYKSYKLFYPNQVIICCGLYLTANGNIVTTDIGDNFEYYVEDDPDNIICNVNSSIYDGILNYNIGKLDCFEYMINEKSKEYEAQKHNTKYSLTHMQDAIDFYSSLDDYKSILPNSSLDKDIQTMIDNPDTISIALERLRDDIQKTDYLSD